MNGRSSPSAGTKSGDTPHRSPRRAADFRAASRVRGARGRPRSPERRVLDARRRHLGTAGRPEWEEFTRDPPEGRRLDIRCQAGAKRGEQTLLRSCLFNGVLGGLLALLATAVAGLVLRKAFLRLSEQ